MATITLEVDDDVLSEIDYLMALSKQDNEFGYKTREKALKHVITSWADASRRPGSWERGCFEQLGLIPYVPELSTYRQVYGNPSDFVPPEPVIKPILNLDGIADNHPYYNLIVLLTDLCNEMAETCYFDYQYFIQLRQQLINHETDINVARLLAKGYLKALCDMMFISQQFHDKYYQAIEDID